VSGGSYKFATPVLGCLLPSKGAKLVLYLAGKLSLIPSGYRFKESTISSSSVQLLGSIVRINSPPVIVLSGPWTSSYLWPLIRRHWESFLTGREGPRPHPHSPALNSIRPSIILASRSEGYPELPESARRYQGTVGVPVAISNRRLPKPSNCWASRGKLENGKLGIVMRSRSMRSPHQRISTNTSCPRLPKTFNRSR